MSQEEGERPVVHQVKTVGNASGSLFSFLILWESVELRNGAQIEFRGVTPEKSEIA